MGLDEKVEEAIAQDMPCVPDVPEVPSEPPDFDNREFYLGKNWKTRCIWNHKYHEHLMHSGHNMMK